VVVPLVEVQQVLVVEEQRQAPEFLELQILVVEVVQQPDRLRLVQAALA
jgi:hypothetical protein